MKEFTLETISKQFEINKEYLREDFNSLSNSKKRI